MDLVISLDFWKAGARREFRARAAGMVLGGSSPIWFSNFFQQVSGDSGSGATLGAFKSRVAGLGPEIGYIIPLGSVKGYLNLKGYGEFAAQNRASGWNLWLTFAISPGA